MGQMKEAFEISSVCDPLRDILGNFIPTNARKNYSKSEKLFTNFYVNLKLKNLKDV